ncbi:MAG: choice-of-anchor L domain-containing protein [Bacteroidota bacterium]
MRHNRYCLSISLATLFFLLLGPTSFGQLITVPNTNATQLVNTLIGPGVFVSNITSTFAPNSVGTFTSNGSNIGINNGVILTSGSVANAPGPNNQAGATTANGSPGDPDLNAITTPNPTFDAAILEFDLVATCDTIQISYVFASEEYPEFVCSSFNDVFAFFISGPGIVGQQNIALIPGSTTPVAINTVNNFTGIPGPGCITTNSNFYIDNTNGATVQYDGFTVPLLAKAVVQPCSTYRLKLAIADAGDASLDSGVFLEAGGIRCASQIVQVESEVNSATANSAVEGCVDGTFTFIREGDSSQAQTVFYSVGGSATPGVDYPPLPGSVTFPPNVDTLVVTVSAFLDQLVEGNETIFLILQDTVCQNLLADTATIIIQDPPTVSAGPAQSMCANSTINIGAPPTPFNTYTWTPGAGLSSATVADPQLTLSTPGVYQYNVVLTDTNGCTQEDSVDITVQVLPESPFNFPQALCTAQPGTFTYTGPSPPTATYNWTFTGGNVISGTGQGPYQVSWATPGNYAVTLEVTEGICTSTITSNMVMVTPLPQLALTAQDVSCNGFSDGSIAATVTSGTPGFTYNWSVPGSGATVSGLPVGTYQAIVSDSLGCADTASIALTQPAPLNNTLSFTPIPCFGGATSATANPTGGTGVYSYNWSNGDQTQTATGLTTGTWSVTITDNTGGVQPCQFVDQITLSEPLPLVVTASSTIASCGQSNGTATAFATGGTPPYSYSWTGGGLTAFVNNLAPGTYTVTVTDANGCSTTASTDVLQTPFPVVTAGADTSFCEGEGGVTISASGSSGTTPYYYTWSCANPPCGLDSINDNDPLANPSVSQWYYVQITDGNGCLSNIDSVFVTIIPKPVVNAGPDIFLCGLNAPCQVLNPTVSSSSGFLGYQWIPGTGLNDSTILNPCARPDTTTTYTLVVTDSATGCTSDFTTTDTLSTVVVHVNPVPIANAGPDIDICEGDSVVLQGFGFGAGPDYTYQWSPNNTLSDSTIPNPIAFPPLTTEYTLIATSNGCPSTGDNVLVTVHTNPTVDAGQDRDICQGDSAQLDAVAGGDSTATYSFLWTPPQFLNDSTLEDPLAGPNTTTMFYVQSTTNFGCLSPVDSVLVTVTSTPVADAGDPVTICLGNSVQLQGGVSFIGTLPPASPNDIFYDWAPAGELSDPNIADPVLTPTQSGWWYFTATTGDCSHTDSVFITVIPEIEVAVTADTNVTCAGDSVLLTATAGLGGASFTWLPATGLSDPLSAVTTAAPAQTTTYLVIAAEGGCADTAEVTIEVLPTPQASFLSSSGRGCVPHTVSFTQTAIDGTFYVWDFGDGSPVSNEQSPLHEYTVPGNYSVNLTVVAPGGCSSTFTSSDILVVEPPRADFRSDPEFPAQMALPATSVQFFDNSEGASSYTWEFGDGAISSETDPTYTYLGEGSYTVTLTVTNAEGCRNAVTHGPFVITTPDLFIPNVFSPNGDGINDRFLVEYNGSQPFRVQVYDRWGVELYESRDRVKGWNGQNASGLDVPDGVYYYRIAVGDKEYAGSVTLVR